MAWGTRADHWVETQYTSKWAGPRLVAQKQPTPGGFTICLAMFASGAGRYAPYTTEAATNPEGGPASPEAQFICEAEHGVGVQGFVEVRHGVGNQRIFNGMI